jgi:UDP-N-acetylglucosamine 1-carboxyvinyltransferase
VLPSTFRKLDIAGVMIFIFREDGYEIKTDIDGSILTIADAPWPGRLIY